jgi:MoaA/NifB/PqqE/SkfB family radical SAM enzyme
LNLKGIHFLLSYRCDLECDHCFVWGTPKARGVFTLRQIKKILNEARNHGTIQYISFEGGEPFLYYPILIKAIFNSLGLGFNVEVLSNCYWASSTEDAQLWLAPIAKSENVKLSLSSDLYHGEKWVTEAAKNALKAAKNLRLKAEVLSIKYPGSKSKCPDKIEGFNVGMYGLMYKGRAATLLAQKALKKPWREFTECPYEELANPKRVHIDPKGYVHVCQGITIGNAWKKPFSKIITEYNPKEHSIIKHLTENGPVALVEKFNLAHDESYADACHLCYNSRCMLREKYPKLLAPDEMYGKLNR